MSGVQKHSLTIRGHRTSVTLEEAFWKGFCACAAREGLSIGALAARVDAERMTGPEAFNLSSAIRLYVLRDAEERAAGVGAGRDRNKSPSPPFPLEREERGWGEEG